MHPYIDRKPLLNACLPEQLTLCYNTSTTGQYTMDGGADQPSLTLDWAVETLATHHGPAQSHTRLGSRDTGQEPRPSSRDHRQSVPIQPPHVGVSQPVQTTSRDNQSRQPVETTRQDNHSRQPAETTSRDNQSRQPVETTPHHSPA